MCMPLPFHISMTYLSWMPPCSSHLQLYYSSTCIIYIVFVLQSLLSLTLKRRSGTTVTQKPAHVHWTVTRRTFAKDKRGRGAGLEKGRRAHKTAASSLGKARRWREGGKWEKAGWAVVSKDTVKLLWLMSGHILGPVQKKQHTICANGSASSSSMILSSIL